MCACSYVCVDVVTNEITQEKKKKLKCYFKNWVAKEESNINNTLRRERKKLKSKDKIILLVEYPL